MQFDRAKYKTIILYVSSNCDRSQLGAVKLHKVLYFLDMMHYALIGAPVTGSTYRKRPHGPTSDELLVTLRDMESEGILKIEEGDYFGFRKKEYIPLVEPEIDRLNKVERLMLDEMIEFVCRNNTAKTISQFSHNRAWEIADFGEELPYHSALHIFPSEVSPDALDWAAGEAEEIEAERSKADSLGFTDYATFRARVLQESHA
uniref:Panacea domain-containing protein n=1 Tax=Pararhizobium sp. IMCC3301 TaxID=3067904 RepID=UPI00274183A5|nr:Panacea domain-containing protein [Pararhizobium sp. IMCC3301]